MVLYDFLIEWTGKCIYVESKYKKCLINIEMTIQKRKEKRKKTWLFLNQGFCNENRNMYIVLRREVVFLGLTGILEEFRRKESFASNFLWGLVVLVRKDERDSTSTSRILDTTKCSITFQFALQFRRVDLRLIVLFATRIALGWCKNQQLNSYELSSKNVRGKRVRERDEERSPFYKV